MNNVNYENMTDCRSITESDRPMPDTRILLKTMEKTNVKLQHFNKFSAENFNVKISLNFSQSLVVANAIHI